jgi:large subunit ribosomal protein L22
MYEARALRKNIHSSPRKMRLVIDLIRGKNATEALHMLRFMPNHASRDAYSVLNSAVKNLLNKYEERGIDDNEIIVKEVFVNQGPTMKRMLPAPMGRAYRVRKRSNHLTIVVSTKK